MEKGVVPRPTATAIELRRFTSAHITSMHLVLFKLAQRVHNDAVLNRHSRAYMHITHVMASPDICPTGLQFIINLLTNNYFRELFHKGPIIA